MHTHLKKFVASPWHPYLFLVFAILAPQVANPGELPPAHALRPFLVVLVPACMGMLLARLITRDWGRAAIFVTLALLIFFTYGHLYTVLEYQQVLGLAVGRHRVLLSLAFLLCAALAFWLITRRPTVSRLTRLLNLITLLLALTQVLYITYGTFHSDRLVAQAVGSRPERSLVSTASATGLQAPWPDIYFIILDTYPRQDALSAFLGYDNSAFVEALRARGFYIADCSLSNYTGTSASVVASLNMQYLDEVVPPLGSGYSDLTYLDPYLMVNPVSSTLQALGYTRVVFDSGYSPTEILPKDVYRSPDQGLASLSIGGLTEYESLLLASSLGIFVYEFQDELTEQVRYFLVTPYVAHRDRILFELDQVGELELVRSPRFVFAHILAPHTPLVFTADGGVVIRKSPFTLNADPDIQDAEYFRQGFTAQITYLNGRVLEMIDEILSGPGDPVIILQGDHGLPQSGVWSTAILNAIRLPGGGEGLYPTISPVNTFRVVFNRQFDTGLPLVEDRSCHYSQEDPTSCQPVSEPGSRCRVP